MASEQKVTRNIASCGFLYASYLTFLFALLLPAYRTGYGANMQPHYGLEPFLLGPIGFFAGHASWLANPLLFGSWFSRRKLHLAQSTVLAFLALATASSFVLAKTIAVGSAGDTDFKVDFGYYAWLLSIVLAAASALTYKPKN